MKKKDKKTKAALIVVDRSVRHAFTIAETADLHKRFRQSFADKNAVEAEFGNVKASYKAKVTEAESRMVALDATIQAGCEMRTKRCAVVMRPADKKKDFYVLPDGDEDRKAYLAVLLIEIDGGTVKPDLTEDMTQDDFQQDLIRGEQAFDARAEVMLWDVNDDAGKIVVGRLGSKWYTAVRANIGGQRLDERLDAEQRAYKLREDAIGVAGKRVQEWLEATLGKDAAAGFAAGIVSALEAERGKVE